MSFKALQAKVARAEDALEAHERQVAADLRVMGGCWRDLWSPPRVIVGGLAAGFLVGWARPARAIAGIEPARWLQLAGSLAGLVAPLQAAFAVAEAGTDAEDSEAVANEDGGGVAASADAAAGPSERRYTADPSWDTPPRPAEAATELSEPR